MSYSYYYYIIINMIYHMSIALDKKKKSMLDGNAH